MNLSGAWPTKAETCSGVVLMSGMNLYASTLSLFLYENIELYRTESNIRISVEARTGCVLDEENQDAPGHSETRAKEGQDPRGV